MMPKLKRIIDSVLRINNTQEVFEAGDVVKQPYVFHIDSPMQDVFSGRSVMFSGWLVPLGEYRVKSMRITRGGRHYKLPHGQLRKDVPNAVTEQQEDIAIQSGFSRIVKVEPGEITIEVDVGEGYEVIYNTVVFSESDKPIEALSNSGIGVNWAEHANILSNKKTYYFEEENTAEYILSPKDVRLIAFYLPQFHPIPENDKVWGRGFTEWTNVTAATPRFVGHLQPFLPKDLGFYDLRLESNIKNQIDLAKRHGIYGFCIYYYWFSGKKILDSPLNSILKHKEWDFNFFICWANENWTKRWDGLDQDVIISQKYLDSDPLEFIKDVEHIITDERYIKEDGKPILAVYRASDLKGPSTYAKVWRNYIREKYNLELCLVAVIGFEATDPRSYGFDKGIDFMPLSLNLKSKASKIPKVRVKEKLLDSRFEEDLADYRALTRNLKNYESFKFPSYPTIMPSWDNDARKKGKGSTVYYGSSPDLYANLLDEVVGSAISNDGDTPPTVFINAWNEWAEGTVLEPSQQYGSAVLNRTSEILAKYSQNKKNLERFPLYGTTKSKNTKLAVVIHVFYEEEMHYILKRLSLLNGIEHDIFITLSDKVADLAPAIKEQYPNVYIIDVPNRGRDILPYIFVAQRLSKMGYEYVLKLHTKRSLHRDNGRDWFKELIDSLIPSKDLAREVIKRLHEGAAIIGPDGHWLSQSAFIGSNSEHLSMLTTMSLGPKDTKYYEENLGDLGYFAGSMFWIRIETMKPLLDVCLVPEDFESENGQVDGTMAHAVERVFGIMADKAPGKVYAISRHGVKLVTPQDNKTTYEYASGA